MPFLNSFLLIFSPRLIVLTLVTAALPITATIAESNDQARPALTVNVTRPEVSDIPQLLSANGSVAAWQEAVISAQVEGLRLTEIRAQVGDKVGKGQVLAVFDVDSVRADVAQSRALLMEAEASFAEAELNGNRVRKVASRGAFSVQQIDQYLTAEKAAKARVASAKAVLDVQLLRLKHAQVVANDEGVIAARSATLGAVAAQGQELFRIIRQNRLEWRGEMTAAEMAKLKPGLAVSVEVPNVGRVIGSVRVLAPSLDPQSRNGLIYVDLPDAAAAGFRAGMFGKGEFTLSSNAGLTVPLDAVNLRDGFSYVYRLNQDNGAQTQVAQVKVTVGRRLGDRLEIVSGVNAGDALVASGGAFLSDGDSVRIVGP
jgi:RND family efflux transporter MFP subunit